MESTTAIAIALLAGVPLAVLTWIHSLGAVRNTVRRGFECPIAGEPVTVEFREEVWDGRPVEAVRSTAFCPPRDVVWCSALERRPVLACGLACREAAHPGGTLP